MENKFFSSNNVKEVEEKFYLKFSVFHKTISKSQCHFVEEDMNSIMKIHKL